MAILELTQTKLKQGTWEGIITNSGDIRPMIAVTHQGTNIETMSLTHNNEADHWVLSIPIPADAISDGVQTLIIRDTSKNMQLGHITLVAGEALTNDIRAEVDLLRSELDMLKRAFRRHCLETE